MTRPHRNDPCPCGSGRKYKRCCLKADDERDAAQPSIGTEWLVDAIPVPMAIEDGTAPRPVMVTVVSADGPVIHHDLLGRLPGEPERVAAALAEGVGRAYRSVGRQPETLVVRHEDVATALASMKELRDVVVRVEHSPAALEHLARDMIEHLGGHPTWPPVGRSDTWRAWDLPRDVIADVFVAAAHYYESAPWRHIENEQPLYARLPDGRAWSISVLGAGGEQFGLALYSDEADLSELLAAETPRTSLDHVRGRIVSLTYDRVSGLPEPTRAELAVARWRLAGPAAYPDLMTVNTPGGGVSQAHARDLALLLAAVPRFVEAHAELREEEDRTGVPCDPLEWKDAPTGVQFRYDGAAWAHGGPGALDEEVRTEIREIVRSVSDEIGPDAETDDVLALVNERLQDRMEAVNARPLDDLHGFAPVQVHRLLSADWSDPEGAVRLGHDLGAAEVAASDVTARVRALLSLAIERKGLGRTQAGNLQVAVVRELAERTGLAERFAVAGGGRTREDDVWPLHEARILADLAGLLHVRGARFQATLHARTLVAPHRIGALHAILFETCFRSYNIFYGGYAEWPELQHQIAFTLLRLGQVAREWRTADELVGEVVLPFALERAPEIGGVLDSTWMLERHVLLRLMDFGLVEPRLPVERDGRAYRVTPLFDRFLSFHV